LQRRRHFLVGLDCPGLPLWTNPLSPAAFLSVVSLNLNDADAAFQRQFSFLTSDQASFLEGKKFG
jgi:hypothetical protein